MRLIKLYHISVYVSLVKQSMYHAKYTEFAMHSGENHHYYN